MAPPRSLPEELVEDILLRFPPDEPARLVHAALVCKPWRAIISGAGFRRRFREFHRTPPLLGFLSNIRTDTQSDRELVEFVPTCSLPASSQLHRRWRGRVLDAHHGRILLLHRHSFFDGDFGLFWTDALMVISASSPPLQVPCPPVHGYSHTWTAALLCAAAGGHLDCCRGPFHIVAVSYLRTPFLCTYSSSTKSWSTPIYTKYQLQYGRFSDDRTHAAHVESESALYFGALFKRQILKFDLESREISWIKLPARCSRKKHYVLTITEGGGLGLATIIESSKLYMWSMEVDTTWIQSRVIELKALLPAHAVLASRRLLGFTVGTGVVFLELNNVVFAIDLKTYKVIKEVSLATDREIPTFIKIVTVIPYLSFYTPAFGAISTGEGPRVDA